MKRTILFLSFICLALCVKAQPPRPPFSGCTAEEEAEKQTVMMQYELKLTQEQRDTIYQINLKYAKARRVSNTRAEMIERINQKMQEFKGVLTKEQYNQYMNCQLEDGNNKRCAPIFRHPNDSGAIPSNTPRRL